MQPGSPRPGGDASDGRDGQRLLERADRGAFDEQRHEVTDRTSVEPMVRGVDRLADTMLVEYLIALTQMCAHRIEVLLFGDVHTRIVVSWAAARKPFPGSGGMSVWWSTKGSNPEDPVRPSALLRIRYAPGFPSRAVDPVLRGDSWGRAPVNRETGSGVHPSPDCHPRDRRTSP